MSLATITMSPRGPFCDQPSPWHALRVSSGSEVSVADAADGLGYEAYCPRYRVRWVRRGKRHERLVPYLATYVFVRFDGADPVTWHDVVDIDGVVHILGDDRPMIVSEYEMFILRGQIGDDGELAHEIKRRRLSVGNRVMLTDGPFSEYFATVEEVDDAGLFANVKITGLLGREVVLRYPASWCERTEASAECSPNRRRRRKKR